jgi:hypothetical protein
VRREDGAVKKERIDVRVRWSKRPARLLGRGKEVSEIKWLDTQSRQVISNDQLEFLDEGKDGQVE